MEVVGETVSEVIARHLKEPASLFVFPSDVSCTSWSDWAIKHTEQTHVRAFNLDQFAAWDNFKGEFFKPDVKDLRCIPAVLRKVFAEKVIAENNEAHLFKKLIASTEGMKDASFGFVDWIAKILPELKFWHERYTRHYVSERPADEEDEDYLTLFELYTNFLREGRFYEPSYVKENLKSTDRKIFIFYPEVLDDFWEFEDTLKAAPNVTLVRMSATEQRPRCVFYEDARRELRFLALRLRKLHYEGVDLRRVAVSVPNLDEVRVYIERELKSYAVPFVVRSGLPYTVNSAGGIFQKIKDCIGANFSYDSVRALLQDGFIPWKDTETIEKLIRAGYERRCVCGFQDGKGKMRDVWLSSLDQGSTERAFYLKLKRALQCFERARTFEGVLVAWMSFQEEFIDVDRFSDESNPDRKRFLLSNKMMGKILSELNDLLSLEKTFANKINYKLRSPFEFFVNEISKKTYEPDEKQYGVNIFPYALAACADFDFQFVLDSSQGSLATATKVLSFISDEAKRTALHLQEGDRDVAKLFVNLYAMPQKRGCERYVHFSAAEDSFGGFSIVHSSLEQTSPDEEEVKSLEELDFVLHERQAVSAGDTDRRDISKTQKAAFANWKESASRGEESVMSQSLKGKVDFALKHKGAKTEDRSRVKISQSELNSFFFCPRKFVFKNVLTLQEDTLDVELTQPYEIGNLVHKMIELICQHFKGQSGSRVLLFPGTATADELCHLADAVFEEAKLKTSFAKSSLALETIESQKRIVCQTVADFLKQFCSKAGEGKSCSFGGFYIDGVELEAQRESETGLFDYFGRIDCVLEDLDARDEKIVVDYKTGTLPAIKGCMVDENGNLSDFQMACYVKLLEGEGRKVNRALFYGIKKVHDANKECYTFETHEVIVKDKKGDSRKHDRDDFEATMDELERCGQYFFVKGQNYDFEPLSFKRDGGEKEKYGIKVFEKCTKCTFASICRTPFNVAKRALS